MLQENTSLQSLNIESNFITSDGMMAIIKAMANNATLVEFKIDNQVRNSKAQTLHRNPFSTALNFRVVELDKPTFTVYENPKIIRLKTPAATCSF